MKFLNLQQKFSLSEMKNIVITVLESDFFFSSKDNFTLKTSSQLIRTHPVQVED